MSIRHVEGRDSTGTVRMAVDGRGAVQQIHIDPRWPDRLGTDALGSALLDAFHTATIQAFEAAADAQSRPKAEARPGEVKRRAAAEPERGSPVRDESFTDWLDRIDKALGDFALLHKAAKDEPELPGRIVSPDGTVTITLSGRQMTGISVDPRAAGLPSRRLALAALSALRTAQGT